MCEFCDRIYNYETDELPDNDFIGYEPREDTFYIAVDPGDPWYRGCIDNIKYCPMCGKKLYHPKCNTCSRYDGRTCKVCKDLQLYKPKQ